MTNTNKKDKVKDPYDFTEFNLGDTTDGDITCISGLTFNMDLSGGASTYGPSLSQHEERVEQYLKDIWHNQATIIKWLSKIAENTKNTSK